MTPAFNHDGTTQNAVEGWGAGATIRQTESALPSAPSAVAKRQTEDASNTLLVCGKGEC